MCVYTYTYIYIVDNIVLTSNLLIILLALDLQESNYCVSTGVYVLAFKSVPQYTGRNKGLKSCNYHYFITLTQHSEVFLQCLALPDLLRTMKIIMPNLSFLVKVKQKFSYPQA